jgi:hypothetical protein
MAKRHNSIYVPRQETMVLDLPFDQQTIVAVAMPFAPTRVLALARAPTIGAGTESE